MLGRVSLVADVALVSTQLAGWQSAWHVRYALGDNAFVAFGARRVHLQLPTDYLTWDGWSLQTGVSW